MNRYILRRLLLLLPTLLGVSILVFGLMRLLPGDVVQVLIGPELNVTAEQRAALYHMLGLDAPLHIQFFRWLGGVLRGDLGFSLRTDQPVLTIIKQRLPVTLELTILSLLFSWLLAIPLGIVAAVRRNGAVDLFAQLVGLIGLSVPNFWLATMLLLLTSLLLRWQLRSWARRHYGTANHGLSRSSWRCAHLSPLSSRVSSFCGRRMTGVSSTTRPR